MEFGNLAAYSGLLNTENKIEQGYRRQAGLEKLNQYVDGQRKEDMMLQELEANEYDQIRKEASTLLERDREKINKKAIDLQVQIKEKIKEYGGRKQFYQNGGLSLLKKTKTELLYSDEVGRYRDNQKNLERIFATQAAGKGSLISKKNMKALTDYQNGNGDFIEFDGLKSEVDIPNEWFQFGQQIPTEQILNHGDNYLRLWNNVLLEQPELKGLTGQDQYNAVYQYAQENHNGLGSDKTMMEYELSMKKWKAQQEQARTVGTEEEAPETYFNQLYSTITRANSHVPFSVSDVLADENGTTKNYWKKLAEKDGNIAALLGNERSYNYTETHKESSYKSTSTADNIGNAFRAKKYYKPASAAVFPAGIQNDITKGLFGESFDPATKLLNIPLEGNGNFYSTDGTQLTTKTFGGLGLFDRDEPFTVGKTFLGFIDENGNLLTDATDEKGNIDKERQGKRNGKTDKSPYSSTGLDTAMFTTIKNEDGNTFYFKTEMKSIPDLNNLQGIVGPKGNLKSTKKELGAEQIKVEEKEQQIEINANGFRENIRKSSLPGGGFDNPAFASEVQMLKTKEGDRSLLQKAFYAAYDDFAKQTPTPGKFTGTKVGEYTQQRVFTQQLNSNPELKQIALDIKGTNDENFMAKYTEVITGNPQTNPEYESDLKFNKAFENTWKQYYTLLKNK